MHQLEQKLDEALVKKAPFQLPEGVRQFLVRVAPWVTLLCGVLALFGAWGVWQVATVTDRWANVANELSATWGTSTAPSAVSAMMPLLWLSLIIILVEGVLYLVAFAPLQKYQKKGWNILFWVAIANVVQGILYAIAYSNVYVNFGQLLLSMLGSLVGLYLLFQVRAYYTGEKKLAVAPSASSTMSVPKETPVVKPVVKTTEPTNDTTDTTEPKV